LPGDFLQRLFQEFEVCHPGLGGRDKELLCGKLVFFSRPPPRSFSTTSTSRSRRSICSRDFSGHTLRRVAKFFGDVSKTSSAKTAAGSWVNWAFLETATRSLASSTLPTF
jgi:hypothetical protein